MKNPYDLINLPFKIRYRQPHMVYILTLFAILCLSNFILPILAAGSSICDSTILVVKDVIPENFQGYGRPTSPEIFKAKDLYDYLDGGADRFRDSGLECIVVQDYTKGDDTITMEIYHFLTKTQAFRFFEEENSLNLISHNQEVDDSASRMALRMRDTAVLRCFSSGSKDAATSLQALADATIQTISEAEKDEKVVALTAQQDSEAPDGSIIIIGASYAEGWQLSQINGRPVFNKGVYGEKTAEMLARFQRDVIDLHPESVIIWGFINDIFNADRDRIDNVLNQTRSNLRKMVEMAQANGIEPILATEVTIRPQSGLKETLLGSIGKILGKQSYQDYVNQHVRAVNKWIKIFSTKNQIRLLDLQPLLADKNGVRVKKYAAPDGSHISPAGYTIMTRYTEQVLRIEQN